MTEKGYLFPDPPDPGEMVCVRIYIPKHDLYIAAFWGAYQFFTTWLAWARDPLKKGRLAAAAWRRAFDKARAEFELTKGECFDMITGIRSNPLNGCELQMQEDGGDWVTVFDASCCGSGGGCSHGALRYNGSAIQQYNPATDEWENIGPETPPSDTPIAPIPWEPAGDGACLAATNFGSLMEDRKNVMATAVGDGLEIGEVVLQALDILMAQAGGIGWVLAKISTIIGSVYSAMLDHYADALAHDVEDEAVCIAVQHYLPDGTMPLENVNAMLADIVARRDEEEFFSGAWSAWGFINSWVTAAGPEGMRIAANFKGLTDPNCDDCPWVYLMDFSENSGGFVRGNFREDPAFYNAGVYTAAGWKTEVKGTVPVFHLKRICPPTVITRVIVTFDAIQADQPTSITDGLSVMDQAVAHGWVDGETVLDHTFTTPISTSELFMDCRARNAGTGYPDASLTVKSIKWFGTGTNPFVDTLPPVGS